jgi:hypothetical protein
MVTGAFERARRVAEGKKEGRGASSAPHGGRRRSREGVAFGDVGPHGMGAAAPGCSDSGKRGTPRGCGGRVANRGGQRGVTTRG